MTAVDPALVEFDQRTTGVDQFCELTSAAHALGARVFIDIVINHTGWGSALQENHPEFFLRNPDGTFASPGAWGTTWEDLVELKQDDVALWDIIADALLTWCRRGVDGFRCDAGYKIPVPAWQYIIARVQEEFPETIFLLEGLGGSWEATEDLLTEGGMQWAYSELFQNYSGPRGGAIISTTPTAKARASAAYVHYSETHDNDRLAEKGRAWSLLRNRLCALTSVERRVRLHLRRRMAGRRKNQGPRLHRACLGQPRQHRSRTGATEPTARRPSLLFRRRETHALERAGFAGLCPAPRIRRRQGFRAGSGQHRRGKGKFRHASGF